jgi:hypothetical protein
MGGRIGGRREAGARPTGKGGIIAVPDITCPSASRSSATHRQATSLTQPVGHARTHARYESGGSPCVP